MRSLKNHDIHVVNFEDFGLLAEEIYPRSLVLNKSNISGTSNSAFLDLNVSVIDGNFRIKVYNKTDDYDFRVITFPYLESNILTSICYSVFFGEIMRYLRISTRLSDFEVRSRKLVDMLVQRKYKQSQLAKQFVRVFLRYKRDAKKFSGGIVVSESVRRVVYNNSS